MDSAGFDAKNKAQQDGRPVAEIMDELGFGWSQVRFALLGGGIWFADGAELLLISSVSQAASKEWSLSAFERGFVVSVVFFGILVGNVFSGPIGDNFGRRRLLLASFLGIFVFSVASSLSASYMFLCIFRFFVGVAMGIGQPAWTSMGSEVTPSHTRAAMMSASFCLFTFGEMYSAGLVLADDPAMLDLHWRSLLLLGSMPSLVFFVLSTLFLHESPVYLANAGRAEEAREVLEAIRDCNSAHGVALQVSTRARAPVSEEERGWSVVMRQFSTVFGRRMRFTTFVVMYSCFMLNMAFYGCMYAFPQVLPGVVQGGSAGAELLIGAMWEFPGIGIGCYLGSALPRKRAMKVYLGLSFLALVMFPLGAVAEAKRTTWTQVLLFGGYYGIKCFVQTGFVIVYQYAVEVYPTDARITGLALNLAAGRAASTCSSVVFELIVSVSDFKVFFYGIAIGCLTNALLIDFLRYETADAQLKDNMNPDTSSSDSDHDRRSGVAGSSADYGATRQAPGP